MGFIRWLRQALLFILLLVVVPLAAIGLWVRVTVLDTDRYVATVAPLSAEPAVQTAARVQIMSFLDGLVTNVGTEGSVTNRLVRSTYDSYRGDIEDVIGVVLSTTEFGDGWKSANRDAHSTLRQLLRGELPEDEDGSIRIDLLPVFNEIKAELANRGVTVLDRIEPAPGQLSLTLIDGEDLKKYQREVEIFETIVFGLAIVAVILALLYVWGAKSTLFGIAGLFVIVAVAMVVIWLGLEVGQDLLTDGIEDEVSRDAAEAIYSGVVARLRDRSLLIAGAGAVGAVVFWLIHRSRPKPVYVR